MIGLSRYTNISKAQFQLSSQSNGVAVVWGFGQNDDSKLLLKVGCLQIGQPICKPI